MENPANRAAMEMIPVAITCSWCQPELRLVNHMNKMNGIAARAASYLCLRDCQYLHLLTIPTN
jgi:hypothetical protein